MDHTIRQRLEAALDGFPPAGRQILANIVNQNFVGHVPAADANELENALNLTSNQLLHALIPVARAYANPPISNYHVGTVVRGTNGDLYLGGNMEFPGMPLNLTVHGEQAAVINAYLHGAGGIEALAVGGTPCGHCRQFLAEINNPDLAIVAPDGSFKPLSAALPNAFMPSALGNEHGLLHPVANEVSPIDGSSPPLVEMAVDMAKRSYAPYSEAWAGAAARLIDGSMVSGAYLESVAFNPTVSAVQVLMVNTRMRGYSWDSIEEIVLVAKESAHAGHEPVDTALVASLNLPPLRYIAL